MADKEKRKKTKAFKADEKALLVILNEWSPIGFDTPEDEYDCLAHKLLSALYKGEETKESIFMLISHELKYHFGISDSEQNINAVSNKIINWWQSKK